MTSKEINRRLELHKKWLNKESDGVRADFSNCNLEFANLWYANLECANLQNANLECADLRDANLKNTNLRNANLWNANLKRTSLENANLKDANLYEVNLENANLKNVNLEFADLQNADLGNADLENANLKYTNLQGANLLGVKNIPYIPMVCPETGSFTAWKKVYSYEYNKRYRYSYLVELLIPEDAKRSSATTNKCRCDKAKVVNITNLNTNEQIDSVINNNYCDTIYKVGEMVYPDKFDKDRWKECSNGIHFFMNKHEAINY